LEKKIKNKKWTNHQITKTSVKKKKKKNNKNKNHKDSGSEYRKINLQMIG